MRQDERLNLVDLCIGDHIAAYTPEIEYTIQRPLQFKLDPAKLQKALNDRAEVLAAMGFNAEDF